MLLSSTVLAALSDKLSILSILEDRTATSYIEWRFFLAPSSDG
jgi:hypothetical protein